MFSIVSMKNVLHNVKGGDDLFKMFDSPRVRNKNAMTSLVASAVNENAKFPITKLWILPSHMLVLTQGGGKEELVAYDQVPKLTSSNNMTVRLLQDEPVQVHDILHVKQSQEHVFIILKSGEMLLWIFRRPEFEWLFIRRYSLCKGRDSQLVSFCYEKQRQIFVWCERRSPTQFCLCRSLLRFDEDEGKVYFEGIKAVLHNCLPMNIYALKNGCFCFKPQSNKPPGLLLFWTNNEEKLTVRMWDEDFNDRVYTALTSDYQTILKECISFWLTYPNIETKIISISLHPSSNELIIVQNDLKVYSIQVIERRVQYHENDVRQQDMRVNYFCTLEDIAEDGKEVFTKQALRFFPIQTMLLCLTEDGTIYLFESKGGLFLWKSQTFRGKSPQIWVRIGDFPIIGVWNRSGIWNLRPKPISEQLKEFATHRYDVVVDQISNEPVSMVDSTSLPTPMLLERGNDPDFVASFAEGEKKQPRKRFKIKQGVNRSEKVPVSFLFNILNFWKLNHVSTEIALNISTKVRELVEMGEKPDMMDVCYLLEEMNDPVLLLVLFVNKQFSYTVKKEISKKVKSLINDSSWKNIDPEILHILKQYVQNGDNILDCYSSNCRISSTPDLIDGCVKDDDIVSKEFQIFEEQFCSDEISPYVVDDCLCSIFHFNEQGFVEILLTTILEPEDVSGTAYKHARKIFSDQKVKNTIWNMLFSMESTIFNNTCSFLWRTNPQMVVVVMERARMTHQNITNARPEHFQEFLSRTTSFLNLPLLPYKESVINALQREQVESYCSLLSMMSGEFDQDQEQIYDILIDYGMIDQAFEILKKSADDSKNRRSMFYKMLWHLLITKKLGCYGEVLKEVVPTNFKITEFYMMLTKGNGDMGRFGTNSIFTRNELSIGEIRSILNVLL